MKRSVENGLIHIYTGTGKGKTTAAVGLAIRAKARGLKVLFAQFMKSAKGNELRLLKNVSVKVIQFSGILSPYFHPEADKGEQKKKISDALLELQTKMDLFDLVILDEFIHLVKTGLISEEKALAFIGEKPSHVELVLTGRGAPKRLLKAAHYVTEMKEIKHPHKKGVKAREGIEY